MNFNINGNATIHTSPEFAINANSDVNVNIDACFSLGYIFVT